MKSPNITSKTPPYPLHDAEHVEPFTQVPGLNRRWLPHATILVEQPSDMHTTWVRVCAKSAHNTMRDSEPEYTLNKIGPNVTHRIPCRRQNLPWAQPRGLLQQHPLHRLLIPTLHPTRCVPLGSCCGVSQKVHTAYGTIFNKIWMTNVVKSAILLSIFIAQCPFYQSLSSKCSWNITHVAFNISSSNTWVRDFSKCTLVQWETANQYAL